MALAYEIRDGHLLWVRNPFTGVTSYAVDLRAKSFAYTLRRRHSHTEPAPSAGLDPRLLRQALEDCPFCPGHEDRSPNEIIRVAPAQIARWSGARALPNASWVIRAFNNLFPRVPGELTAGRNESYVIVEDPRHFLDEPRSLNDLLYTGALGEEQFFAVMDVVARLTKRALENTAVGSVTVRKNQGPESGASQPHVHQQVIGAPSVLPALEMELRAHREDPRLWEEMVELASELELTIERVGEVVSYVNPAGTFPQSYDVIAPRCFGLLSELSQDELRSFAAVFYRLLAFLGPLPLDYEIHQGLGLPLHAHINVRVFPYSNVAGTLNIPRHLPEIAARIRRAVGTKHK
jgi:UDPglucose--hexose-1-phosphate uridylyltransferase